MTLHGSQIPKIQSVFEEEDEKSRCCRNVELLRACEPLRRRAAPAAQSTTFKVPVLYIHNRICVVNENRIKTKAQNRSFHFQPRRIWECELAAAL